MLRLSVVLCVFVASAHALLYSGATVHGRAAVAARGSALAMMAKTNAAGKKMVTVLLNSDVTGVGVKGSAVLVKAPYAENVIVRGGLGAIATPADLERVCKEQEEAEAAAVASKKKAEKVRDVVSEKYGKSGLVIEVQMKDGKVSETVSSADVASMLNSAAKVNVAAEDIEMETITELGSVIAELKLHPDVKCSLKVVIEKSKITFS